MRLRSSDSSGCTSKLLTIMALVLALGAALWATPTTISADGEAIFSGRVMISNLPAPDGTKIYARVGRYISNIAVVRDGVYTDLRLVSEGTLPKDTPVKMFIGGWLTAPDTESAIGGSARDDCARISSRPGTEGVLVSDKLVFEPGTSKELDLSLSDPDQDTDHDGLSDVDELLGTLGHVTEPTLLDTDDDGYSDWIENKKGSNPNIKDSDCDGILDPDDIFPTRKNQEIYVITGSVAAVLLILGTASYHLWFGLTRTRKQSIQSTKQEKHRFSELCAQLQTLATEEHDGFIKLEEVMDELGVDEELALRCLNKLKAARQEEYYIVR